MSRGDTAKELFLQGYNCTQAVLLAFKDLITVDETEAFKISLAFGGGLSRQRLVCGAVSGMAMVISSLFASDKPDFENKKTVYGYTQEVCNRFMELTRTLFCGELLQKAGIQDTSNMPSERTQDYYKKRPCPELIKTAGDILETYLRELNVIK